VALTTKLGVGIIGAYGLDLNITWLL